MAINNNYTAEVGIKFNDAKLKGQLKSIESKTIKLNLQLSGGTSTQINSINKALNKMKTTASSTVAEMNALGDKSVVAMKNVSKSANTASKSINNASKNAHTLGSRFVDITKKVVAFGAITSMIGLFTKAMSEAVKVVSEFDASLTELKKVSDLSGEGLDEYTQKAYIMARELSTSATNITDATTAFVQAGYSLEESTGLSKYAIMLQGIADETMDTETATNFLTSTIKAFNLTASDAEHVISAVNETSNKYALTSNDLSENMGKVAGVAGIAGVSMEELIGLMTSSIEKTRNASKSANAFKSIFINLQQMNESGTLPKLSKKFDDFGISMTDSNGKIKSAYDLLRELADAYKQVSNSTDIDKQNKMRTLLEDIGGKYNYNVLVSSLSGFDTAISATETAMNSAGSAQKEFDKSLDSIKKRMDALQGAFLELVNGDGGFSKFIKSLLSGITTIMSFANTTGGMRTILITLGGILGVMLIPKFLAFYDGVQKAIVAMKTMAITATTTQIALGGVVAVIALVSLGYSVMAQRAEEAKQAQEELYQANIEQYKQAEKTLEKLKNEKLTRAELIQVVNGFSEAYGREVDAIKNTDEARKKSIELIEAEKKAKAQAIIDTSMTKYKEAKESLSSSGFVQPKNISRLDRESESDVAVKYYNGLEDKLAKLKELKDKYSEDLSESADERTIFGTHTTAYDEFYKRVQSLESQISETLSKQNEARTTMSTTSSALETLNKTYDDATGKVRDMTDAEKLLGRKVADTATEESKQAESQKALTSAEKERVDGLKSASDEIDNIQSSYTTLSDAVSEYNKNGSFSLDTVQSLLSMSPKYLSLLEMQNGKLVLNEKAMRKMVNAQIEESKQLIWNTAATKLNALEKESNSVVSINSASDWIAYQNEIRNTTVALQENSGAEAYNKALKSTSGDDVNQKKRQKIINDTRESIKLLNGVTSRIKLKSSATDKSTSSTNKESSAIDKSIDKLEKKKDSLEALKDKYGALFDAIQSSYDKEIDKLEKLKDINDESHQSNIDYLNSLIDSENDLIDKKEKSTESEISRLEKLKLAQDEFYDNELKKLEDKNTEKARSIELSEKEQALAKAQSQKVLVYTDGGWKAVQDKGAVESARKDLDETRSSQQLERQRENIENLKESSDEYYDGLIENQNTALENYKTSHETVISNLETLIEKEESTQKREDKVYDTKIKNIKALKESVETLSNKYQELANIKLINKYLDGDAGDLKTLAKISSTYSKLQSTISGLQTKIDKKKSKKSISTHASGVASVGSDEIALVGENPHKEMVIGSRANGQIMSLSSGSGVVNAKSTSTLAGILNSVVGLGKNSFGGGIVNTSNVTSSNAQSTTIHIDNLSVVANDTNELVNSLISFELSMAQQS